MKQGCCLLVDEPVVANIRPTKGRFDRVLVDDSWDTAKLKCQFVSLDGIIPENAIVPISDLLVVSSHSDALR